MSKITDIEVVYRCKSPEESQRRVDRAKALVGTPFIRLPGDLPGHQVAFVSTEGHKVRVSDVEMVFNDAALMDAISNWGEDGPLYKATLKRPIEQEIYNYAIRAYKDVELPPQLVRPPCRYQVCPKCSAMYDYQPGQQCLTCKVPLRPATEQEVKDFEEFA